MAMPHFTQMYVIQRRLKGKFGKARLAELRKIWEELPGYKTGPYGEIRKWIQDEIVKSKVKRTILAHDDFFVKREGASQIAIVGPPNIGKSSLLNALCGRQIKIADYAFTTLKPVPSTVLISGVQIQLVEVPGIIEGASSDKGLGKRLLAAVRDADALVFMFDLSKGFNELEKIRKEIELSTIMKKFIVVGNKSDLSNKGQREKAVRRYGKVFFISAKEKENLNLIKEEIWKLTGLIRVYTKEDALPTALEEGATVRELAMNIHKELAQKIKKAKIIGPSAKFSNQIVSINHILKDGDRVWLLEK